MCFISRNPRTRIKEKQYYTLWSLLNGNRRFQTKGNTVKTLFLHSRINQTIRSSRNFNYNINLNYYLILAIILVSALPLAFGDQVSPHLRCDITEKMTWSKELQKHDCIPTTFVKQESKTCREGINYFWNQTGVQSYEQVDCSKTVTKIEIKLDFWEQWEQYAWDFVFSNRYGW